MRLIDADEIKYSCKSGCPSTSGCEDCGGWAVSKVEIDDMPTIEIPETTVIKCGKCIYFNAETHFCTFWMGQNMTEDDFCSNAIENINEQGE